MGTFLIKVCVVEVNEYKRQMKRKDVQDPMCLIFTEPALCTCYVYTMKTSIVRAV